MLAEKEWQAAAQGKSGPDIRYCEVYSVLMNRPLPRCCWAEKKRYADVFNRVEHGG